jgi:hypothetical protein
LSRHSSPPVSSEYDSSYEDRAYTNDDDKERIPEDMNEKFGLDELLKDGMLNGKSYTPLSRAMLSFKNETLLLSKKKI